MTITTGEIVLLVAAGILLLELLREHVILGRGLRYRTPADEHRDYPSLSVIRPIKGLDADMEANLQAALDHGYPGRIETLFVFDDEDEPAVPLVERAIAAQRRRDPDAESRIVYSGPPPPDCTGKLNAMIHGLRRAGGELIAFVDSDTRAGPDALRRLVDTLIDQPRAGTAFAPVVASEPPRTAGDAAYALLLNGLYGPAAADNVRRRGGDMPFIMGQFMVFRRETIDAIGGLESAAGQLVDDMYLGTRVARSGRRNVVSPERVPIIQRDLPLRSFWGLFLRWIAFSRTGPTMAFKVPIILRVLAFLLSLALLVVALVQQWWLAAACLAAVPLALVASVNALHHRLGGGRLARRHLPVVIGVLLAAPLVWFQIVLRRRVNWRGREYQLDGRSALETESEAACGEDPLEEESSQPAISRSTD